VIKGMPPKTYNISITNKQSSDGTVFIKTEDANNRSSSILITAENLNNFIPARWKCMKNGEWSGLYTWDNDKKNKYVASSSGTIVVKARVFDANGYYIDSNILTINHASPNEDKNEENIDDKHIADIDEEKVPAAPISFTDVALGDWFYDAVQFVVNAKLFKGIGNNKFAPNAEMTRAMYVTVLGRIYEARGGVIAAGTSGFSDVESGAWYTNYVVWAEENGLVNGYGNGLFGATDGITREQLAVLITRFAEYLGTTLSADIAAVTFTDSSIISAYAADAVQTVQRAGIMQGLTDGSFNPAGTATRAEVAIVLMRLMNMLTDLGDESRT